MREERRRLKRAQKKRRDAATRRASGPPGRGPGKKPFGGPAQRGEFFKEEPEVGPLKPLPAADSSRKLAFRVLEEHRESGQFIGQILEVEAAKALSKMSHPAERRLATELANGIVRRQITLDAILKKFVDRPQDQVEPRLWTLLRIGAYQLVLASGIKAHAAVDETVELARWCDEERWCGLLNGVLRSIQRSVEAAMVVEPQSVAEGRDESSMGPVPVAARQHGPGAHATTKRGPRAVALDPGVNEDSPGELGEQLYRLLDRDVFPGLHDVPRYVSQSFGLPLWLVIRWERRFDRERLFRLASSFNFRPPMTLRVNPLRTSRDELLALLRDAEQTESSSETTDDETASSRRATFGEGASLESLWCRSAGHPASLPGFAEGLFTVQDETALSAARLLDPKPGQRVLDLCAAPGTKTTHLAELMKNEGHILAADSDADRLKRVPENAARLGLDIIETALVKDDLSDLAEGPFDAILVDVLCSNTGVLGKRPEVRTRLRRGDVEELAELQLKLLTAAAARLAPGGRLVYSTCSIEPEENSGVLSRFLDQSTGFRLEATHEFFPAEPSDGGFQALLIREA